VKKDNEQREKHSRKKETDLDETIFGTGGNKFR
jgi:hypothetical protein